MPEPITANSISQQLADCPSFLSNYLRYLEIFQNRKQSTVGSVYLTLREFLQYIHYKNKIQYRPSTADAHKDMSICKMDLHEVAAITREDIDEFLCFLDTEVRNTPGTMRRKLSFIRVFYQYILAQREELGVSITENPTADILIPSPSAQAGPKILTTEEISRILQAVDGENAVRDYAIILLIVTTGLPLHDVILLNEDCYDGSTLTTRGQEARTVSLTDACIQALDRYLLEYRAPLDDLLRDKALFVSKQVRQRITARCAQRAIVKAVRNAGLEKKGYTAQDLRDTAVATILCAAPDTAQALVMEYLGFRSPKSGYRFKGKPRSGLHDQMAALVRQSGVNAFGE